MAVLSYEITERRDTIFQVSMLFWFLGLIGYFYWLFTIPEDVLEQHLTFVDRLVPQGWGLEILIILWPFYATMIGMGITNGVLRLIYRLKYGQWV